METTILTGTRPDLTNVNDYQAPASADNAGRTLPSGPQALQEQRAVLKKDNQAKNATVQDRLQNVAISGDRQPTNEEEKGNLLELQQMLAAVLTLACRTGMAPNDVDAELKTLEEETKKGRFGPATQDAYKKVRDWLEKAALPGALTQLSQMSIPSPPGCPIGLPTENGFMHSPDFLRAQATAGGVACDLKLDTNAIPGGSDLDRLHHAFDWLDAAQTSATDAQAQLQGQLLEKTIKGIVADPEKQKAWLDRQGSTDAQWRSAAVESVDLASRIRNYVEAMYYLNSNSSAFPLDLPPGVTVKQDKDGKVTSVQIDLWKDLRLDHPETKHRMDELREWLGRMGPKIDQATKECVDLENNPNRLLFWGEMDSPKGKLKLNESGEVTGFPDDAHTDGSEKPFNLVQMRFNAQEITDKDGHPKIRVTNSVQYQESHFYNYLNIGASDVGKPLDGGVRDYDPDDFVAVRDGGKVVLVQAKNLNDWATDEKIWHYGEKAVIGTLDAAMLVTGTIEVGTAFKGVRLAAKAGEELGEMAFKQALKLGTKGALDAVVGGSGFVLNNAWADEHDSAKYLQYARGLYFLGDGLGSLGATRALRATTKYLGAGKLFGSATSAAEIGEQAKSVQELLKGTEWLNTAYKGTHLAMKMTEPLMLIEIGKDIKDKVKAISDSGKADPLKMAIRRTGSSEGDTAADEKSANGERTVDIDLAALDRYKNLLDDGKTDDNVSKKQVDEILGRAKTLMQPGTKQEDRDRFKAQLMTLFMPKGDDIQDENGDDGDYGKAKHDGFPDYRAGKDRSVQMAAATALMYLCKGKDGNIPDIIAQRTEHVPERTYTHTDDDGNDSNNVVPAHDVAQQLTADDLAKFVRGDLEMPVKTSNKLASADLALQLGIASGREVALEMQDVLHDPSSSRSQKEQALVRIGSIVDALKTREVAEESVDANERYKDSARQVGGSSQAVETSLKQYISGEKDADLRALADGVLFASGESTADQRKATLSGIVDELNDTEGTAGAFAIELSDSLNRIITSPSGSDASSHDARVRKLRAAASLALIADTADSRQQQAIDTAIVDCMSVNDIAVANSAIEALVPDRLRQMQNTNPELAKKVVNTAIAILIDTQKQNQNGSLAAKGDGSQVELIDNICSVIGAASQTQRQTIETQLLSFIDPTQKVIDAGGNEVPTYLSGSAPIRKATIDALAAMGSMNSLRLLRIAVQGAPDQKVSPDSDSTVRLAALNALERLKDPQLRKVALAVVSTESDPDCSQKLRDLRFATERVDPTSSAYRDQFDATAKDLIQNPYGGCDKIRSQIDAYAAQHGQTQDISKARQDFVAQWRDSKYPLLSQEGLAVESARLIAEKKAPLSGFCYWMSHWSSTMDRERAQAAKDGQAQAIDERDRQLQSLCDAAKSDQEDGQIAKMCLSDIMMTSGRPFSNEDAVMAQRKAAQAIADLCQPGVPNRNYVISVAQLGLMANASLDQQAKLSLINAVRSLMKPDKNGQSAISQREAGYTFAAALDVENKSPTQDSVVEAALIDAIGETKYHPAYAAVDAMTRYATPEAKVKAQAVMENLRDRVSLIWDATAIDTNATNKQRAERLSQAFADTADSDAAVQAIASAMKGAPLAGDADPRLATLRLALNDSNTRVRLAAAYAIVASSAPSSMSVKDALHVLADIKDHGERPGYKLDAAAMLDEAYRRMQTR